MSASGRETDVNCSRELLLRCPTPRNLQALSLSKSATFITDELRQQQLHGRVFGIFVTGNPESAEADRFLQRHELDAGKADVSQC